MNEMKKPSTHKVSQAILNDCEVDLDSTFV